MVSVGCLSLWTFIHLVTMIFFSFPFFISPLWLTPSLADFTARMKLTRVGVPMVCAGCVVLRRKEKKQL